MIDDSGTKDANYQGQKPTVTIHRGPENIRVQLQAWGPKPPELFATLFNKATASWGSFPSRITDDRDLTPEDWKRVEAIFDGKTLPQHTEFIGFSFLISGIT